MTTTNLSLATLLGSSIFYHTDVARSSDSYVYENVLVSYNEPDNVTCAGCGWRVGGFSHPTRNWPYLWQNTSDGQLIHPPMGIRSSPALGGLGAGSVELRADGSFRDWTIFNQGPAGSGKFGLVDDAFMAVRVGGSARVLRTHAPQSLGGAAQPTAALAFSGSYPLTRLAVEDAGLVPPTADLALFGYSTLWPTQPEASAAPALVLTLRIANRGDAPLPVDFMFALPLGAWTDCSRQGGQGTAVPDATSVDACMRGCNNVSSCASWQFERASRACTHNADVPLTAHRVGTSCGVKGKWAPAQVPQAGSSSGSSGSSRGSSSGGSSGGGGAAGLQWTQRPDGVEAGPSLGEVVLLPVAGASGAAAPSTTSMGVGDVAALYARFAATGSVGNGNGGAAASSSPTAAAAATAATPLPAVGAQGAVGLSTTVAARTNATLSIVFAWHFADRDYDGDLVGNRYAHLFADAAAVAASLGSEGALAAVVGRINAHHATVASLESPYPVWLKDMLLNQWSHLHASRRRRGRPALVTAGHSWPRGRGPPPPQAAQVDSLAVLDRTLTGTCSCGSRTAGCASTRRGQSGRLGGAVAGHHELIRCIGGLGLPSALGRSGPAPQIPRRSRGVPARGRAQDAVSAASDLTTYSTGTRRGVATTSTRCTTTTSATCCTCGWRPTSRCRR